jgi:hypothetical protein
MILPSSFDKLRMRLGGTKAASWFALSKLGVKLAMKRPCIKFISHKALHPELVEG